VWTRILHAAGRLMAESGVAAVSVGQILLAAGVSRGTFYSYCRNKSDLLVALIEPVFEEGTRDLAGQAHEPAAGVVPGIVALYRGLWQRHRHALLLIPGVAAATFARLRTDHLPYTDAVKAAPGRAATRGYLRSGCADYSFRVQARTAVPLLRVYADHPDGERLYAESLTGLVAP
jgi:AcrR family transcriptional regulator